MAPKRSNPNRRSKRLSRGAEEEEVEQVVMGERYMNGDHLIGRLANVKIPGVPGSSDGSTRRCFVLGCQFSLDSEGHRNSQLHQLFEFEGEMVYCINLGMDLSRAEILPPPDSYEWVGKRIVVWWKGTYANQADQSKARQKFGKYKTKIPYEAWIVGKIDRNEFVIVYTVTSDMEMAVERKKMKTSDDDWEFVERDATTVRDVPIVSWSGNSADMEDVSKGKN